MVVKVYEGALQSIYCSCDKSYEVIFKSALFQHWLGMIEIIFNSIYGWYKKLKLDIVDINFHSGLNPINPLS